MRKIFFVIGPSGVGKTKLVEQAIKYFNPTHGLEKITSCITRSPRPNEEQGKSFLFVNDKEFDKLMHENAFIEYETYAGLRHGLLKSSFDKQTNLIKEITPKGLEKVLKYAKQKGFLDEIRIISIYSTKEDIYNKLVSRGETSVEIENRHKSDSLTRANIKPHIAIYNKDFEQAMRELRDYVEKELGSFSVKEVKTSIRRENMIKIHSGHTVIKQPDNPEGRFVHIVVDSATQYGVRYYVTVDSKLGKILGCTCPSGSMFPYRPCKHQKAVIRQRLLGEES